MKALTKIFPILFLVVFAACGEDPEPVYDVPQEVDIYVQSFLQEASARGVNIELDYLTARVVDNLMHPTDASIDPVGLCKGRGTDTPEIELDGEFDQMPDHVREQLIFHELGHCILDRGHKNLVFSSGQTQSIMYASDWQYNARQAHKREYYLDELFNTDVADPQWANSNAYDMVSPERKEGVFIENFDDNQNGWSLGSGASQRSIVNGRFFFKSNDDNPYYVFKEINAIPFGADFEIEMGLKIVNGSNYALLLWGGSSAENLSFFGHNEDEIVGLGDYQSGYPITLRPTALTIGEYNKLTIRKLGETYYFYINEEYLDHMDYYPLNGNQYGFSVGGASTIHIDYFNIYEIKE